MNKTFEYKLDGEIYNVLVIVKNNKNTYIKIKDDCTICVTTSLFTTKRTVKNLLDSEQDYLRKVLKKVKQRQEKNEQFYFLGHKYDIIKVPFDKIEIDEDKIYTPSDKELEKWMKKQTKKIFAERLDVCYELFEENIPKPKLKIRQMKTRWGVCKKIDETITLNSRLIRYDIHDIDYVVIHELSHLVHFDHSRAFWNTVEKYMPDYKKSVKVLKE